MAFEFGTIDPAGECPDVGVDVFGPLAGLSPEALISTATYSATMNAANTCRMLMVASLLHEQREEDYLLRRSESHSGEAGSVDELATMTAEAAAGRDPYAEFGPNGLEQAAAEFGAAMNMTPADARNMIRTGDAMRYRLPLTGTALACGRIDLHRFQIAERRTDFVDDAAMPTVDAALAEVILARDPMSTARFTALVDKVVHTHAPEAVKRRNEHAARDRGVTISPDRHQSGRSRITGHLPHTDAAALNAQLSAMAATVHTRDPRTTAQRRADALLALAHGKRALDCQCRDCIPEPLAHDLDTDPTVGATAADMPVAEGIGESDTGTTVVDPAVTDPAAIDTAPTDSGTAATTKPTEECTCSCSTCRVPRPTYHIIGNLTTLQGLDDDPGMLDGHGLIDAATMRRLFVDAIHSVITTGVRTEPTEADVQAAAAASTYVPSKKLQALVRAGELCCTFPGCNQPVWTVDLDHTHPFDHRHPDRGGKTTQRNLKPLCRFHHRIKTFGAWRDSQDEYMAIWFEAPTGHVYLGNPYTGRDLFSSLKTQPPDHPARRRLGDGRIARTVTHRRQQDEWNRKNPPPF
ncbi:HNH endonuclease [Gordonia sp. GONU]|uniref:HNH endonuclease signature motif containing protein n=1 Tax=Gordonia sp. GONU TaxID=2972949 RepID=UPI0021ACBF23|nr:HNH endonuclease signature motif containing protein [Gordonia sp. GONU]MCR8897404.1 HNH endonuclease [Gordonia sp. GONU]